MSLEQDYYDFLTRTDHPVFRRDFSLEQTKDSPFNSILNRLMAKQLAKMRAAINILTADTHPHTVTADGIGTWESRYFNFTKPGAELQTRRDQLTYRINGAVGLTVSDVVNAAISFTGKTPIVIRNAFFGGWILDESILDVDTVLNADDTIAARQTYYVIFDEPIPSGLLDLLDKELTKIEKAGSQHFITAPLAFWVLDESRLDIDTILQ